jgi:phosphoribosylformimino-5-aminoimidazole carboxamide ribotide isomerase
MNPKPTFTIYPAIDLRDGKVVRLAQGDPQRQTIYGDDPRAWAERWKGEGAAWLHIINLSGAFDEDSRPNLQALQDILAVGLKVEFGGGIRDAGAIRAALELGVERVFLGTAAIQDPALVDWAITQYGPGRIAGDIGARDGMVTIKGWQQATTLSVAEVGRRLRAQGIEHCVLTDVARDGVGSGVNLLSALELQKDTQLRVVASGGISSLEDVHKARQAGLWGVIIGRALYDGKISLRACFSPDPAQPSAQSEGAA